MGYAKNSKKWQNMAKIVSEMDSEVVKEYHWLSGWSKSPKKKLAPEDLKDLVFLGTPSREGTSIYLHTILYVIMTPSRTFSTQSTNNVP